MDVQEFKKIIEKEGNFKCWKQNKLTCIICRYRPYSNWCGYVGVTKNNKLYGINCNQKTKKLEKVLKKRLEQKVDIDRLGLIQLASIICGKADPSPGIIFDVHGGLTFSGQLWNWKLDNKWVFGFDTAHSGDLVYYTYYSEIEFAREPGTYRTKEYVIEETNNLAKQLSYFEKIKK